MHNRHSCLRNRRMKIRNLMTGILLSIRKMEPVGKPDGYVSEEPEL